MKCNNIKAFAASVGKTTPNQDAFVCETSKGLFGVFDGVGSVPNSDKASQLAAKAFSNAAKELKSLERDENIVGEWLKEVLLSANWDVKIHSGSQTTATIAVLCDDIVEPSVCVVNVGDSRLYGFNIKEQRLDKISKDDSLVLKYPKFDDVELECELSYEEYIYFRDQRNIITKVLGAGDLSTVGVKFHPIEDLDGLLLTTDGIHDNLTSKEILEVLTNPNITESQKANVLVQKAKDRSNNLAHLRSKHDDITAVYVKF